MMLAVIPAKNDSGRLPGKNMLPINGVPLVGHAVAYARKTPGIDRIAVSTDSEEIAAYARTLGVEVVMRGPELGGEIPLAEVYRHAWRTLGGGGWLAGIQPDNPDRTIDIAKAVRYAESKGIDYYFTVDGHGARNGSLHLMNENFLAGGSNIYSAAAIDDCTNIHTRHDYLMACRNLSEHADAILIGDRPVGNAHPMFVIAEGACNHLCQMDLAYQMIDKAVEAGADAIKFQTYKAEKLVTDQAVAFWGEEKIRQIDYYRRLDRFDKRAYQDLFAYAKEKGIIGFSSPFDDESADMLNELGMEVFKIASCEVPNKALITRIASYQKPVILSTGASGIDEINRAIDAVLETGNTQLILLACTLSYPTQLADANLRRITTLKEIYKGFTVGLSDHTEPEPSMAVPAAATTLGAKVIEKHYTLDRTMTGSGHFFALDPNDLANLVRTVRTTESILGDGSLGIADSEQAAWNSARRSIVASRDIPAGETLSDENLAVKRPGGGWPVEKLDEIKGWVATRPIQADERLSDDNAAPCVSN